MRDQAHPTDREEEDVENPEESEVEAEEEEEEEPQPQSKAVLVDWNPNLHQRIAEEKAQ